ncbi:hypothetical protein IJI28_01395 [Candidatus Saccharibacteria bacterium]|nr:hypothetical protein [Candidatus Saccharibacteria bacterium]
MGLIRSKRDNVLKNMIGWLGWKCYNEIAVGRVDECWIRSKVHSDIGSIKWKGKEPTW